MDELFNALLLEMCNELDITPEEVGIYKKQQLC